MNCDEAFDRLTDAAATTDAALLRHLAECPRCQAMQQTLSPALNWMKSAAQDEFPSSTPGGWNDSPLLTEAAVAVATSAARRAPPRHDVSRDARKALGIALVALCGMAFGVFAIGQPPHSTTTSTAAGLTTPATVCLWPREEGETRIPAGNAQAVVDSCVACHVPAMLRH